MINVIPIKIRISEWYTTKYCIQVSSADTMTRYRSYYWEIGCLFQADTQNICCSTEFRLALVSRFPLQRDRMLCYSVVTKWPWRSTDHALVSTSEGDNIRYSSTPHWSAWYAARTRTARTPKLSTSDSTEWMQSKLQSILLDLNPLKTEHRQLYLNTQFVPRSKHFSSRL